MKQNVYLTSILSNRCYYFKVIPVLIGLIFPIFFMLASACTTYMTQEDVNVKTVIKTIDGDTVIPRDANKIYIHPFLASNFSEISKKLVVNIKEIISIDGRLAIVDKRELADVELKGKIVDYQIQNIVFGKVGTAEKKRIRIVASIRLINTKNNQLILYENDMQAFKEFSDVIIPIESEDSVRIAVIKMLARRISSKTITGWYSKYLTPIEKKR